MLLSPHSHHLVAALNPLSSTSLLASLGALGVFLVLFAETGLLVGFFLPGDSLLFTAGLLCTASASHAVHLSLPLVILAAIGGALLGAQTGFLIGRAGGRPLLQRSHNRFLRNGAGWADQLLERYGYGKAIVLGRFIPVVRTVLNPMAGALAVPARTFTVWQVIGGVIWSAGVTLAGYGLGSTIPSIDTYLLPIIAVIVVVSLIPIGLELFRTRSAGRGEAGAGSRAGGRATEISGPGYRGRAGRADLPGHA
ncbi:MAG: DedA family protein, partial [Streptosporangiales bacterium]